MNSFDNVEMYLVGGYVRDLILGTKPKDLDFTIVADSFEQMQAYLISEWGVETFVSMPEYGTIRGRFTSIKKDGDVRSRYFHDIVLGTAAADFVLARKEGHYTDGRRPDSTEVGTLEDDLKRRDFTVNAVAVAPDGGTIDLYDGFEHAMQKKLVAVGNAKERFDEDALRTIRALRFVITKGFEMDDEIRDALKTASVLHALENNIAVERIRDELHRCFKHDTIATLDLLAEFRLLREIIFRKGLWLEPTLRSR